MKKVLLTLIIFFVGAFNISALEIISEHAVMYNLNDNTIVYEKEKDGITKIASLTKIMTTLVAVEEIEDLQATILIDDNMFEGLYEADAAVIGLVDEQIVTYEDLLYGTFISSGADATRALTISLAGSEENFVKLMNKKAKGLGMVNTHFVNATGLDEPGQKSTVDEVAKLLKVALENETFRTIFESKSYSLSDSSLTIYSTLNNIAVAYGLNVNKIIGSKTGYTDDAGFCLASLAYDKENDIKYLLVTTKAPVTFERAYHLEDAVDVYDYYFSNYKYHKLVEKYEELINLNTKYSNVKNVNITFNEDIKFYYDNTFDKNKVRVNYDGIDTVSPVIKKGEKIGEVDIFYDNEKIKAIDVLLEERIPFSLKDFLISNALVFGGVLLFIVLVIMKKVY